MKISVAYKQTGERKRVNKKADERRGPKRCSVPSLLSDEFERLYKARLKFKVSVFVFLAKRLIENAFGDKFDSNYRDSKDEKKIIKKITARWVQTFRERYSIGVRSQTSKLMVSTF